MVKENYNSILQTLLSQIQNGDFPAGSLLPTENELAARYNVSRPTITKVYNTLQDDSYVTKKKGLGTRVIFNKSDKSRVYGLLLPGAGESEIFSIINNRFLERSQEEHFTCCWEGTTAGNAELRRELTEVYSNIYISRKVDGVFFAPLERISHADEINKRICEKFAKENIPVILIDRDIVEFPERSTLDLVSLDNFNAGYTMASHLLDSKCTRINFVFRPDSAPSVLLRRFGVAAAVHQRGLRFDNGNVYCGNPEDPQFVSQIGIVKGETGIVCANDSTAAVLMSTIDSLDVRISEDVLISGFDDMKYAEHLKHPLSSYSQPCREIADVAIDLMGRRLKNRNAISGHITVTGKIVPRGSTVFSK